MLFKKIMGFIVVPIVMAIVFFLVVTPIGLVMNMMSKNLLNKRYDKKKETYWIKRNTSIGTMKRQI